MGLSVTLSNALSGMRVGNESLDILSRNIANSGTPGYHRQSLSVIDRLANSPSARTGDLERVFNKSLQSYYTRQVADTGFASVRSSLLNRLQASIGRPGDATSLDTQLSSLRNALSTMATSPDDPASRADMLSKAQSMASTLNRLTRDVQGLRQETETRISTDVGNLNQMLGTLDQINTRLKDISGDGASRASLMDQRDRLVTQISELIGVRADYRDNGTVALTTLSGIGLIDGSAGRFEFTPAGQITADSTYSQDATKNSVGTLTLITPSGLRLDMAANNSLQGGELAGLIELRDKTLVDTQKQLDQIAAGLAQAFSTTSTNGTAVTVGAATGFDLDLSSVRSGNDFRFTYTQGGVEKSVKVVRVDDLSKLPIDYVDADGTRVIGLEFAGGAAGMAGQLSARITGLTFSGVGSTLRVLDDGATGNTDMTSLTARTTASTLRDGGPALSLFVDAGNTDFTNSLDGTGQATGFAGRITVNSLVVADSRTLVQHVTGAALGDSARADYLFDQLNTMRFNAQVQPGSTLRSINGTVGDLVSQTMNIQGDVVASAITAEQSQVATLEAIDQRMAEEYSVDVDEEMARLTELQAAYAANARVITIVQELLDTLMAI
jgi:flagellar hook-associated protein 1 FlgK